MADGAFRQLMRTVIPRKLRWLAKALFKRTTGLYYRDIMRQLGDVTGRLDAIQHQVIVASPAEIARRLDAIQHQATVIQPAQIETQGEVMDLILRRLRVSEEEIAANLRTLEEQVATLSQPLLNELSARTAGPLNLDRTHVGFRARFGLWINDPVIVEYTPDEVRWVLTNERVVEVPFTLQAISALAPLTRIIDIGASESLIALELASLRYQVTALDTRSYGYSHPNLTVVKASILDWEGDGQPFDAAILLSTLEHIGLPVYGQTSVQEDADEQAMTRVRRLLHPGGLLVLTTPFGRSHTGETQRTYAAADLARLLKGFRVQRCCLAMQLDSKTWVVDGDLEFESLAGMEDRDKRAKVILISAERV